MTVQESAAVDVDRADLLRRAQALIPTLKERAAEAEKLGRVPEENVELIVESGLIRAGVPVKFGGYDVEFETVHDVATQLGRGCGPTAWCYALWGMHSWWVGYYPLEAQEELFADGPDVLTSSANFSADSRAEVVDGGYRVSGRWRFASGIDHARWVFAIVHTPEGPLGCMVPREDFKIIVDSWQVSGLQGTGSKDLIIDDVFVPKHRTALGASDLFASGPNTTYEIHRQRRYAGPRGALTIWELVAPAIGMAQATVDEMVDRLTGTSGGLRTADSPLVQAKIAESAAEVDASSAILHHDMAEAQDLAEAGTGPTPLDVTRYARDKAFAMKLAVQAAGRMFEMSGGRSLALSDPLQRVYRDVQAAAHRDGLVCDFSGQPYAQLRLGLEPTAVIRRGTR